MFKNVAANIRSWALGTSLAVGGALLVRLVAPHYPVNTGKAISVAGHLLAIAGLYVIAFGVSRRLRQAQQSQPTGAEAPDNSSSSR